MPRRRRKDEEFWALRNVSFELHRGEALGLVGRNGAGKSTLLKIVARITAPTAGRVVAVGRMATLLEVGTGFHPELSGRENVFLNGAILGMRRQEIDSKLDAIVEFAGISSLHRRAGKALFQWHARAACVLGRRAPGIRRAAGR